MSGPRISATKDSSPAFGGYAEANTRGGGASLARRSGGGSLFLASWRDWKAWALIGIVAAYLLGAWAALTVWGSPECVNDYDRGEGYEDGCFGGTIRYRGLGGFLFLTALSAALLAPWILKPPSIPDLIARSGWRRRILFLWLEGQPPP